MRYLVSKEIKSETKVGKSMYLFDLFFLIIYMAVSFVLVNLVHPSWQLVFYLYSLVMAVLLTSKSYFNKKRRNYQSMAIILRKDTTVYRPVANISKNLTDENEEETEQMFRAEKAKTQKTQKKKAQKIRVDKLLPITGYVQGKGCYVLKNQTYMNLIQINSKDLVNSSQDEVEYDCMKFAKEYKLEDGDLKLVVLNYPCDTRTQQEYYKRRLERTGNQVYKKFLQRKLDELVWLGKNDTTREFYFMVFAKTIEELEKRMLTMKTVLHTGRDGLLIELTDEKKHQILYRLNNKSNSIVA